MPDTAANSREAAAQAELAAALLALGRTLERGSLLLTAAALLALIIAPLTLLPRLALFLAVVAGLAAHFFALRTAFDQPVFAAWGQRWRQPGGDPETDLVAFDAALADTGLRPAATTGLRPLADRLAGARRLLWRQGLCCILQLVAWLAAALLAILSP